ncbi:hypothetical protein EFA46_007190 [Halarchaeum sp. CBA1220]|uniref:DUF7543 family protein n=1 Tax=Halarchaeum sp. CBA1220 TaxID=1853682 RepID=UPI000F3A930F|nr:hypothetical protein [Halarchaeum sp. CBA1220]QLC33996.1 hypothetical protein EFA46_007190 [Halarchaeum sp. CBA1220]
MEWHEQSAESGERWEREDGHAVVWVRETATGDWAVTYDRLRQAPEGSAYRHRTVATEADARSLAAEWRGVESAVES